MLPTLLLDAGGAHERYQRASARTGPEEITEGVNLDEWRTSETSRWGECCVCLCSCICVIILLGIAAIAFLSLYSDDLGLANSTTLLPHTAGGSV